MKAILATLVALAATASMACTTPATGTLTDAMTQAVWSTQTGSRYLTRRATIRISMPALADAGFGCLRWRVELVLPPGHAMAEDDEGNPDATELVNLAPSEVATFDVALPPRLGNHHVQYDRAWLRVRVRNPMDSPGVYLAQADGSPLWLYPVTVKVSGN